MFQRSETEWLEVCHKITGGHVPLGQGKWGGAEATYWEAIAMSPLFAVPPKSGGTVLDLGCGNGRLAIALLPYEINYIGIDPLLASIDFCCEAFKPWPNYQFWHAPLRTPTVTPYQDMDPLTWKFPLKNASVDWAAIVSVFTHLQTADLATHYVEEFRRVLKPGGIFWSTWFRSPPNEPTSIVERTVFTEAQIVNMLAGFKWLSSWGGLGTDQHNQWHVWTQK